MNNPINYNQAGNAADFMAYTNNTNSPNVTTNKQQYYNQNILNGGNNLSNFQHQNEIDFQINYNASQPLQAQYNCGLNNEYMPYYPNIEAAAQSTTQPQIHQSNSYDFLPMSTPVVSTSTSNTSAPLNGSNSSSISSPIYQNQASDNSNHQQKKLRNGIKTKKEKSLGKIEDWEDDDEEDDDDEDEEDDDEDEDDEDTDTDDLNNSYFIGSKRMSTKKNSKATAMSALNADNDIENDYEIKHNCLTEDGVYLNTLFNSPSSLSSISSSNNTKESSKTLSNKKRQVNSKLKANGKKSNVVITKTESLDESEHQLNKMQHYTDKLALSSSLNSSRSSSLDDSNETTSSIQKTQQHMSNMINSYSLAGIMNDYDLVNLPLRELNKRLRFLPKQMAYNMKKRRRTLKNRKYAQNCRSKRLEQKSEMEIQNTQLKVEINRLNKLIEKLQTENVSLKSYMSTTNKVHVDSENNKNGLVSLNNTPLQTSANLYNHTANTVIANRGCSPQATPCNANSNSQLTHLLSLPLLKSESTASTMPSNNRHQSINAHFM